MNSNILLSQKTYRAHFFARHKKTEPKKKSVLRNDLVDGITVSGDICPKPKAHILHQQQPFFKGKPKPGFWLFNLILLVSSLPFLCFGLLFYVLVLGSKVINQKCSVYKSVNLSKCEFGGIAPSPSYRLIFIFLILLASVCGPKNLGSSGSKKSRSNDEVVVFEESHNTLKSNPLACSVDNKVLDVEGSLLYLEQGANTSAIYSENDENGQLSFLHDPIPDFTPVLVGHGEIPTSGQKKNKNGDWVHVYGCGDTIITGICDDCLLPIPGIHQCMNKGCPNCWEQWVYQRAEAIFKRLLCSNAKNANWGYRLTGLIVSPPDDVIPASLEETNMWLRDATEYIKSKGLIGGVLVPHFWRVTDEGKKLAAEAGMKYWEWIHLQGKDWKRYTKNGLHFHLVGYIKYMKPPERGERFIYETLTNDDGSVPDFRDASSHDRLMRLIMYDLNHTAAILGGKKFDSVRWIGSMAPCMFPTDEVKGELGKDEIESEKRVCPECGGNVRERWEAQRMCFEGVMNGEFDGYKYVDACEDTFLGNPPPPEGYVKWTIDRNGDPPSNNALGVPDK